MPNLGGQVVLPRALIVASEYKLPTTSVLHNAAAPAVCTPWYRRSMGFTLTFGGSFAAFSTFSQGRPAGGYSAISCFLMSSVQHRRSCLQEARWKKLTSYAGRRPFKAFVSGIKYGRLYVAS